MSSINSVSGSLPVSGPGNIARPTSAVANPAATPERGSDRVELSDVSGYLAKLKTNDVRTDKVATVKNAIANNNYEDDYKLDVAAGKLLDDLFA